MSRTELVKTRRLFDRSRVVTDWKCKRRRYLNYEYDGTGLQPGTTAYELYFGTAIHDALEAIAVMHTKGGITIDEIAAAAHDQLYAALSQHSQGEDDLLYAKEQAILAEGLVRGFYKYAWPRITDVYPTIITMEQEIAYEIDGMTFMSKPDLLVATSDDAIVYIEYKTTGYKNDKWLNSWRYNPQIHSAMKVINETQGIELAATIVQGLYKGYESYGKQTSPFCYAYARAGQPPFYEPELSYVYKAGFKKFPVWELEGGLKKWVDDMPEEVLAEQFPQVPPVYFDTNIAEAFFRQAVIREKEIQFSEEILRLEGVDENAKATMLDHVYPQNFEACAPSFGPGCPFLRVCHGNCGVSPYELGFKAREPHHTTEIEAWSKANVDSK